MSSVTKLCRDILELSPLAQQACNLFMERCKAAGLDIFITETYRSQERQDYLFTLGRTVLYKVDGSSQPEVTWTHNSRHTSRRAWDIACRGGTLYNLTVLAKAGQIAADLGITWGGTWNTPDRPHFEISRSWEAPAAEIIMAEEDEEMPEKRYNTIDEVPEWGRATIQKLIDKGCFADTKALNLSDDMVRVFVVLDRKGN